MYSRHGRPGKIDPKYCACVGGEELAETWHDWAEAGADLECINCGVAKCKVCGTLTVRKGQKHGCLQGDSAHFASLRNPLPEDYVKTQVERYNLACESAEGFLGAALWLWLREQLERWSEEHRPEAHMLFRQGNGVEVLWIDDVMIETWWCDKKLDEDDERRVYFPLVAIMDKLTDAVCAEGQAGIGVSDLEIRAGKLVVGATE